MTERVCLGWNVSRDEWDAFIRHVEEKWGCTDGYLRFELESAMREFLDKDDRLHDAEHLLRDYLHSQGLSSSSDSIGKVPDRGDTRKLGHRVNAELKDEFAAYAKKRFDRNFGATLGQALNSYRDGGRRQRILGLIQDLVTDGSTGDTAAGTDESMSVTRDVRDTTSGSDESSAATDERKSSQSDTATGSDESPLVDAMLVSDIAKEVGEGFFKEDLEAAVATTIGTDSDPDTISTYVQAVIDYQNVVEHPIRDGLYINETTREGITVYGDLNREERVEWLREMVCADALRDRLKSHSVTYTDVQDLFEEELSGSPSHDYAYKLMRDASEEAGFEFDDTEHPYRLRVDVSKLPEKIIREAGSYHSVDSELVSDLLSSTAIAQLETADEEVNGDVTAFTAGQPPTAAQQKGAADDD